MPRKYSPKASKNVQRTMHKMKRGKLHSGKSGRKVKNAKQAIAIGLSEARHKGAKVPPKKTSRAGASERSATSLGRSSGSKSRSRGRTNSR